MRDCGTKPGHFETSKIHFPTSERSGGRERSEQSGASKRVNGASERANGRASGPVLLSVFLVVIDHSVMALFDPSPDFIHRPTPNQTTLSIRFPLSRGLLCDLLWSDPDPDVIVAGGWAENDRGVSYTFGKEAVSKFLKRFGLDLICRWFRLRREAVTRKGM